MNPSIWIYGGVHDDPGSRQRFLEELAKQETAPHFVAVEWEKCVFERLVEWRPWIEENLRSCWGFLTPADRHELSRALAWEGDAYKERFPAIDSLWLEEGFQEENFKRGQGAKSYAQSLLKRLCNACEPTMAEWIANAEPPPEPRSKKELIDRVWRNTWEDKSSVPGAFERDTRWETAIYERSLDLRDGWIAVVVGWQHANPGEDQRLHSLLRSRGLDVISVRLGP